MLQKTIPYTILSGAIITALAWLAQNMSLMGLYDSASTWLSAYAAWHFHF